MAIPKKSRFTERISKMRGLLPIEKDLLKRIGELTDGAINNRGPTNPGIEGRRRLVRSPLLPPPKGLKVDIGPKNAKLEWQPVDSPILLMYEVELKNVDTNLTQLKMAFTNRLNIGQQGTFQAKVRSVSRDGRASPYSSTVIRFTIQDDLIFLEGNGVGPTQAARLITEDIFTPGDYRLFAWGAFNLANFSLAGQTSIPIMDLSVNAFYPIISRLNMFRETFLFSNVDDSTLTGEIRPGGETRTGLWMSPQAAMFKPFYIDPGNPEVFTLANTSPLFYMFMNQRDDASETNLTLLSIPASVVTIEEEQFRSTTSIEVRNPGAGGENLQSSVSIATENRSDGTPLSYGAIPTNVGNQFTVAFWIKYFGGFEAFNANNTIRLLFPSPSFAIYDKISATEIVENQPSAFSVLIRPADLGAPIGNKNEAVTITCSSSFSDHESKYNLVDKEPEGYFPPDGFGTGEGNGINDNILINNSGKWVLVTAQYDSTLQDKWDSAANQNSNKAHFFFGKDELAQGYGSANVSGLLDDSPPNPFTISDNVITNTGISQVQFAGATVQGAGPDRKGIRVFWIAMWDGLLGSGGVDPTTLAEIPNEIRYLSENPQIDLRTNQGDYQSSTNLMHWWVFGRNPAPTIAEDLSEDLGFGTPFSITTLSTLLAPVGSVGGLKNDFPNQASGLGAGGGSDASIIPPSF